MNLMKQLRQTIRAVREYPEIHSKFNIAQYELRQAQQALERSEQERERLGVTLQEQLYSLDFAEHQVEAAQSALAAFCPKLFSAEEMKRFYSAVSSGLDPGGFTLYHVAEKLTELNVPSFFPYEDSQGLFEQMEGHQLLDWLIALRFEAVDWTMIPHSTYEAATLRDVDTSSPEYQAFEKRLYRAVLVRMGFEDFLAPERDAEEKTTELKLYSPLRAWVYNKDLEESQPLEENQLVPYRETILQGLEGEHLPGEAEWGLMASFDGSETVNDKVISALPSVEVVDGELYGVAVCQIKGELTPGELEELKAQCTWQYAYRWGNDYSKRPHSVKDGDLYVKFWRHGDFFILSKEELERAKVPMEQAKAPVRVQPQRGGDAR